VRRSLPVLSANRPRCAQRAPARPSFDAKIILWLKYFGRWDGVTPLRVRNDRLERVVILRECGGSRLGMVRL
jgi:hypothetical protein